MSTPSTPSSRKRSAETNLSKATTFMSKASARAGDELPDPAEADHAERLAVELVAAEAGPRPLTAGERRVGLRHVPEQRQGERERVLGGRDRVGLRCVRDDDPALGGSLDVDVVDSGPGATDRSQPVAFPISSAVIFVAERIRIASNSPIRASSSPSGQSVPTSTSKSSRSRSTPASAIFSLTRTFGLSLIGFSYLLICGSWVARGMVQPTGAGEPASLKTAWAAATPAPGSTS